MANPFRSWNGDGYYVSLLTPNGDSAMDEALDAVKVSVIASSGAGGQADNSAFTEGTSTIAVIGGEYNTSPGSLTSGRAGAVQLTQKRAMHVNPRDSSGNELLGSKVAASSVPVVDARGTKTFSTNAPATVAALALAANAARIAAVLVNAGNQTVYLGKDNTLTTNNGIPVNPGATLIDDASTDAWWAITASGTGALCILEVA